MESAIKECKEKRSRFKHKVTSLSNRILHELTLIRNIETLSALNRQMNDAYDEFNETHFEYVDLVSDDDLYESYRTVSGLELTPYFEAVQSVYTKARQELYRHLASVTCNNVNPALKKAEFLATHLKESSSNLIGPVKDHIELCNNLRSELQSYDSTSSLLVDLDNAVMELDYAIIKHCSGIQSSSDVRTSYTGSISNTLTSQPNPLTPRSDVHEQFTNPDRQSGGGDNGSEHARPRPASSQSVSFSNPALTSTRSPRFDTSIVSAYEEYPYGTRSVDSDPGTVESARSVAKFKKSSPPTFGGDRRAWPEFRAVWRKYGATEFNADEQRAWALKQCLKGEALEAVRAVYVTQPRAYERIWERLDSIYCDISLNVQSAYVELKKLTLVRENDLRGLVRFVNEVELSYSQLGEVGQLRAITMTHIDDLTDLLPMSVRKEWMRAYLSLDTPEKIHPFPSFMRFLERERLTAQRLAERQGRVQSKVTSNVSINTPFTGERRARVLPQNESDVSATRKCLIHSNLNTMHDTSICRNFLSMIIKDRYDLLKRNRACFVCLGRHLKNVCISKTVCSKCNKAGHHYLLCYTKDENQNKSTEITTSSLTSFVPSDSIQQLNLQSCSAEESQARPVIFAVQSVPVIGLAQHATVFFDSGSNTSFITHRAAKVLRAKKLSPVAMDVTTLGNVENHVETCQYEIGLITTEKSVVSLRAFGMDHITGKVSKMDLKVIQELFPGYNVHQLQRKAEEVDILIGMDYYGFHPRKEIVNAGENLSILEGPFGLCIQGSHPRLSGDSNMASNFVGIQIRPESNLCSQSRHIEFEPRIHLTKAELIPVHSFIEGEEMGTDISPKCGGCRCGKCPITGHTYSFKEEQELEMIRRNLRYDESAMRWITKYPWIQDPSVLPDNYYSALATLSSTERTLRKDEHWADIYAQQILDMVARGVARRLSPKEIRDWEGPVFYISHLAVQNPRSTSTPVRIVFNSSQQCKGVSLNSVLAKGPDAYINDLLGILLRWREESIVMVGDITKMYNSVHIEELEQQCHRFLWRNLEPRDPDIYVITRVNMGDKPAGAISTEAIYMTADKFEGEFPSAAQLLRSSTYVDDIVDSVGNMDSAITLARETEELLRRGGFKMKHWHFSKESLPRKSLDIEVLDVVEKDEIIVQVLGVFWDPVCDQIRFVPSLNFSQKRKGVYTATNLTEEQVPDSIPIRLTRRMVLEQTMKVYDPLGILSPFTLKARSLLRETWTLNLGWDDPLPENMRYRWIEYFQQLFSISELKYDRCLRPSDAVGSPILVILSDASDIAYGFAAYIRWMVSGGGYWSRLMLAKCKIAPQRKRSTPQMELNGAVLSKRGRKVIEKESRFEFSEVYQIVDSETVLCMINRNSTRFKLYEGVRIGEIQTATGGDMSSWYWISGIQNTADWLTRGKYPDNIGPTSEWWRGPDFLHRPVEEWGIKSYQEHIKTLSLEKTRSAVADTNLETRAECLIDYDRFSSHRKLVWAIARIRGIFRLKSFSGGSLQRLLPSDYVDAKRIIATDVQRCLRVDSSKRGKYFRLCPQKDADGLWRVGSRVSLQNPLNPLQDDLPVLIPNDHPYTRLAMRNAHVACGHGGRDATLARFRQEFWTPQGSKLARTAKTLCQMCKLRDVQLLEQTMGKLPVERLRPSPPFNSVMLDLFGPYPIRGEIQKRTTGKGYGVIFTDLGSRAVHIEGVYGYDTSSFVMALTRFACVRGWPCIIFSDPGSQLVGAERELQRAWAEMNKASVYKLSTENGVEWRFGPADSPWWQGAVESMVKAAKRCFNFALNGKRVTSSEFQTLCAEAMNMLNERPLGILPGNDSTINILTPNCLLMGRSLAANPGGFDFTGNQRQQIVSSISRSFWARWTELYAPTMLIQQKWFEASRDLKQGDVVVVADSNALRSRYYIATVKDTFPGKDGRVRRVTLEYKSFRAGERVHEYKGGKSVEVMRSVQRLALLVPVGGRGRF